MTGLDELEAFLSDKPGSSREQPFGPEVLVFKVGGKIFALVAWEKQPLEISLKCDPENALFLRARFAGVRPGYHLNKKHWNSIILDGKIPTADIQKMINESYDLVLQSLSKKLRNNLSA